MMKYNIKKHRKGAVLALMVMVVLILSIASLALISIGTQARLRSVRNTFKTSARFAADAGVERAIYLMNEELQAGTWTLGNVPTFTSQSLSGSNADYTVTFSGDLAGGYELTSVGQDRSQTKTVIATLELTSPIADDYAIFARDQLTLKALSTVGGYNSSDPTETDVDAKIGSQSTESNVVDIKTNSNINADIFISQNGSPDTIIKSMDQLNINGDVFYLSSDLYLPPISPPDYTASNGSISGKNITLNTSDSGKYDGISISNNGTLSINGNVTLYVTGDIDLNNNAEIEINNNSSLKLYFDGDIDASNSSGFNNTTEIPANLEIYGTGTDQDIDIKNSADIYGVVYAPNAEMTVHNKVDAYGSFIVKEFELKNGGEVYYDKALRQITENDDLVRFTVTRWKEL